MAKHEQQAYERLGAKVLTLPDVIAQSVGFMGPVFSSAFVIPLVVGVISASGKGGGVASPLSVLIAAVGVFAIGAIVSRYAREVHAAGSLYDYVTRGLGERTGTAAGWLSPIPRLSNVRHSYRSAKVSTCGAHPSPWTPTPWMNRAGGPWPRTA